MEDRYLFRGKDIQTGKWAYGSYIEPHSFGRAWEHSAVPCILSTSYLEPDILGDYWQVIPETVGQCTGLEDKNGVPIFEGDVVCVTAMGPGSPVGNYANGYIGIIEFIEGAFWIVNCNYQDKAISVFQECDEVEVIDNIHDNPELLEV